MFLKSILPKSGSKRSEKLLFRFTGFKCAWFCSLLATGNKCSHLELSHGSENSVCNVKNKYNQMTNIIL